MLPLALVQLVEAAFHVPVPPSIAPFGVVVDPSQNCAVAATARRLICFGVSTSTV